MPKPHPNMRRKRTLRQREVDLAMFVRFWAQRRTLEWMAEWVKKNRPYSITVAQVCLDVAEIKRRVAEIQLRSFSERQNEELAGLDLQERELWDAWERSKTNGVVRTTTINRRGNKTTVLVEGRCGDASYQNAILAVRKQRAELLGLAAPMKHEVITADLGQVPAQVVIELPDNGRPEYQIEDKQAVTCDGQSESKPAA